MRSTRRQATPPADGFRGKRPPTRTTIDRLRERLDAVTAERDRLLGERETGDRELQLAHEELQAFNDELQQANAALVVSEEELRVANAELARLNQTLQHKVSELTRLDEDLDAMLASADVAMVFLDMEGRITRFTRAAARVFNLRPADRGRPIAQIAAALVGVDLAGEARAVIERLAPIEREADGPGGRRHLLRMLPRYGEDRDLLGVVVTALDVTTLKAAERDLGEAQRQLRHLNATLERRVIERTKWLSLLHDVTSAIGQAPTSRDALQRVLRQVCLGDGWEIGLVYQLEPGAQTLVPTVHHVDDRRPDLAAFRDVALRQRYPRGQALPGRVCADGTAVWIDDQATLAASLPLRGRLIAPTGLRSAALVPVVVDQEVLAVLELLSTTSHEASDELRRLMADVSTQLAKVLERERTSEQIAEFVWREQQDLLHTLHDSLGQTLTGLGMLSAGLRHQIADTVPAAAETAQQIAQQAQVALEEVRTVSKGLFPVDLDAAGLVPALRQLAATTATLHGIHVEVQDGRCPPPIDGRTATQLYRIAQEAVTNAVKHARAGAIEIRYRAAQGSCVLTIADDGSGIEADRAAAGGLGLRIMKHRAISIGGTLAIERRASGGTTVSCAVPMRPTAAAAGPASGAERSS